jgi:hypothetical protein
MNCVPDIHEYSGYKNKVKSSFFFKKSIFIIIEQAHTWRTIVILPTGSGDDGKVIWRWSHKKVSLN